MSGTTSMTGWAPATRHAASTGGERLRRLPGLPRRPPPQLHPAQALGAGHGRPRGTLTVAHAIGQRLGSRATRLVPERVGTGVAAAVTSSPACSVTFRLPRSVVTQAAGQASNERASERTIWVEPRIRYRHLDPHDAAGAHGETYRSRRGSRTRRALAARGAASRRSWR